MLINNNLFGNKLDYYYLHYIMLAYNKLLSKIQQLLLHYFNNVLIN